VEDVLVKKVAVESGLRRGNGRFKRPVIANAWRAAEQGKLLGMEVEDFI